MRKTIYLIRHGQTDYNKKGIVQGSGIDASLNELGRQQGRAFYLAYRQEGFDKIYVSALKRTFETVKDFLADGIPYEALPGLNEISWGTSEGTEFTSEQNSLYQKLVQDWQDGKTDRCVEGGESPDQVMVRQQEAFDYISGQQNEEKILICMHGRAMRILLCWLSNRPLSCMDEYHHDNLGLYILHYDESGYSIKTSNDISHLISIREA